MDELRTFTILVVYVRGMYVENRTRKVLGIVYRIKDPVKPTGAWVTVCVHGVDLETEYINKEVSYGLNVRKIRTRTMAA